MVTSLNNWSFIFKLEWMKMNTNLVRKGLNGGLGSSDPLNTNNSFLKMETNYIVLFFFHHKALQNSCLYYFSATFRLFTNSKTQISLNIVAPSMTKSYSIKQDSGRLFCYTEMFSLKKSFCKAQRLWVHFAFSLIKLNTTAMLKL